MAYVAAVVVIVRVIGVLCGRTVVSLVICASRQLEVEGGSPRHGCC